MGLALAAMLAFLPLAPVALIGEIIPGADDVLINILAFIITPFVMLFN